jgi:hypothetical protein
MPKSILRMRKREMREVLVLTDANPNYGVYFPAGLWFLSHNRKAGNLAPDRMVITSIATAANKKGVCGALFLNTPCAG